MEAKSNGSYPNLSKEVLEALGITNPELKIQSHGLTHKEVKEIQYAQSNGNVKKIKANRDSNYEINEHEAHLVHVTLDDDQWEKGKKLSSPRVAKFYKDDFDKMSKTEVEDVNGVKKYPENAFSQWKVDIIHYPGNIPKGKELTSAKGLESLNDKELLDKYIEIFGEKPDPT